MNVLKLWTAFYFCSQIKCCLSCLEYTKCMLVNSKWRITDQTASWEEVHRSSNAKFLSIMQLFSYPAILTYVFGTQKNCLIEVVLWSSNNICFGWEIRKIIFSYAHLSGGLIWSVRVCIFGSTETVPITQTSSSREHSDDINFMWFYICYMTSFWPLFAKDVQCSNH